MKTKLEKTKPTNMGAEKASSELLTVDKVTKVFTKGQGLAKSKIAAVNNVSFSMELDQPEIFTLAGESGSGKSTMAKLILGFETPTSGQIGYKGERIAKLKGKKEFMREVQPVFQNPFETFNPLKKVDTYLYETVKNFRFQEADQHQIVEKALALVGLSFAEVKDKYPSEMSGGQLQRTSIARALITNPSLLITDEPVSMIDASLRMSIINLFKKLKETQGVSIIYITHDLATAYYVSDRIAIMLRGQIVEIGPVEKVLDNPLHPYTQLLKASIPVPNPAKKWVSDITLSDLETKEFARSGCKFSGRCPKAKAICKEQEPDDYIVDGRSVKCHLYK